MIKPETKLRFAATQKAAIIQAKKDFHGYCVISRLSPENRPIDARYTLDGADIFPRSTFPELAKCVENILPMIHYRHSWRYGQEAGDFGCLDLQTPTALSPDRITSDRIKWLSEHLHEDCRPLAIPRLKKLITEGSKISGFIKINQHLLLDILGDQ